MDLRTMNDGERGPVAIKSSCMASLQWEQNMNLLKDQGCGVALIWDYGKVEALMIGRLDEEDLWRGQRVEYFKCFLSQHAVLFSGIIIRH